MKKQTKELLKAIDEVFKNNPFAIQKFKIDGHIVSLQHRFSNNKLKKTLFVDGFLEGRWFTEKDNEICLRFGFKVTKPGHSAKLRKTATTELKKRGKTEFEKDSWKQILNSKIEFYTPVTSAKISSIVAQWYEREINKSIEMIDSDGYIIHKIK